MSKPVATVFVEALEAALKLVSEEAGYHTNLGYSVHRGYFAHVLKARDTRFPAVVIHPGTETPISTHGNGQKAMIRIEFPVVLAIESKTMPGCYDELQACSADLRRALSLNREALSQIGQHDSLSVGTLEPDESLDSNYILAALVVGISVIETYSP